MRASVLIAVTVSFSMVAATAVAADPPMTQERLHDLITEYGADVIIEQNVVEFTYDGARLACISDAAADRMRIISPIIEITEMTDEQMQIALIANFHSVLDSRYAISGNVLYSAYIHPLSPLTDEQVKSAIRQVASAHNTFGAEYSSGELFFPIQ